MTASTDSSGIKCPPAHENNAGRGEWVDAGCEVGETLDIERSRKRSQPCNGLAATASLRWWSGRREKGFGGRGASNHILPAIRRGKGDILWDAAPRAWKTWKAECCCARR